MYVQNTKSSTPHLDRSLTASMVEHVLITHRQGWEDQGPQTWLDSHFEIYTDHGSIYVTQLRPGLWEVSDLEHDAGVVVTTMGELRGVLYAFDPTQDKGAPVTAAAVVALSLVHGHRADAWTTQEVIIEDHRIACSQDRWRASGPHITQEGEGLDGLACVIGKLLKRRRAFFGDNFFGEDVCCQGGAL